MDKHFFVFDRGHQKDINNIEQDEYLLLKQAKHYLLDLMSIEEHLNSVIENYVEFERELYNCCLQNTVYPQMLNDKLSDEDRYCFNVEQIYLMNRRVINLLTSGYLYIAYLERSNRPIYKGEKKKLQHVKNLIKKQYDSEFSGYRVMCALRNHCQHYDIPFKGINQGWKRVVVEEKTLNKFTLELKIQIDELEKNSGFKQQVLNELKKIGKIVDLTPLIREYILSLGKIHLEIRKLVATDVNTFEEAIQNSLEGCKGRMGFYGLPKIMIVNDSELIIESENLFDFFIKRRRDLEAKNFHLDHFTGTFISSEAPRI